MPMRQANHPTPPAQKTVGCGQNCSPQPVEAQAYTSEAREMERLEGQRDLREAHSMPPMNLLSPLEGKSPGNAFQHGFIPGSTLTTH